MKAPRWLSTGAALACLVSGGCSGSPRTVAASGPPSIGTRVVAVDVSQSAKDHWPELYPKARNLAEETVRGTRLAVFRFDVSVAEVYDGDGVLDAAEAGKRLKPIVQHKANASGTNLALVVRRVVERASDWPQPIEVNIVTDCGIELMSKSDREFVRATAEAWRATGEVTIRFHGVTTGHREALRDIVPGCVIVEQ